MKVEIPDGLGSIALNSGFDQERDLLQQEKKRKRRICIIKYY